MSELEKANSMIESSVASLYVGFYKLRLNSLYQEEYDSMGALLNILQQDRQHLREKYKLEI